MMKFILKRILGAIPTVFFVITITTNNDKTRIPSITYTQLKAFWNEA